MNTETAIDTFLANWKDSSTEFYNRKALDLTALYDTVDELRTQYKLYSYPYGTVLPEDFVEAKDNVKSYLGTMTNSTITILMKLRSNKHIPDVTKHFSLSAFLDKDAKAKKEALIMRAEKKGGKIVDASYLYIADDGNLNGYVICENATVTVRTILAGGEVQCLHYRVLVK